MMVEKRKILSIILIILIGLGSFGIFFLIMSYNPIVIKTFPNPFIFEDGSKVKTENDWDERREEIKELLQKKEYGRMPGDPDEIEVKTKDKDKQEDGSTYRTLEFSIIRSDSKPKEKIKFTVWTYTPKGKGPFPTVVKVGADGIGSQIEIKQKMIDRGYMFVCYNHTELEPDTMGYDVDGPCQEVYDEYSWGSLAVWAWGAMRVADYLLEEDWVDAEDDFPDVDEDALIITGHSRRGKTALLAGALDERFSMVVPNGSGCGGAGSFLVQGFTSEQIVHITSEETWKAWFRKNFNRYANNEKNLPFDQHFLRALVAPRIILSTDAMNDYWANPTGTQAVYEATIPVYEFLDAEKNNAIHYRWGGHGFNEDDFEVLLDFSDKMLLDKDVSGDFYMTPYTLDYDLIIDYEAPD